MRTKKWMSLAMSIAMLGTLTACGNGGQQAGASAETTKTAQADSSQSGETADSLAALREAKEHGIRVLGIVNVVGSSIAREADNVMYTWAGPEIAVATTKAYSTQLIAHYLLALKHLFVPVQREAGPRVHGLAAVEG